MPTSSAPPPSPSSVALEALEALLSEVEGLSPAERVLRVVVASQDADLTAGLRAAGPEAWGPLLDRLEALCAYRPRAVREWRARLAVTVEADASEYGAVFAMLETKVRDGQIVPVSTPTNLDVILEHDPEFAGAVKWCEFTHRVLLGGEPLSDARETEAALAIGNRYGLHYTEERIGRSLHAVARRHPTHPVREYLEGLRWDGVRRLDRWLTTCCGVDASERLAAAAGRRFMVSAVARIFQPGCKVDTVLILVGKQGAKKSTAFRCLFGSEWFADTAIDVRKTDAMQALDGTWCLEWAELDNLRRSEATAVKAFITSPSDKYRPPYGRNFVERARQCVFVGTTNEQQFLNDPTGSRRFWALPVTQEVDPATIVARRDQLWAEAVVAYRAGEKWWLDADEELVRAEDAERFAHSDTWEEVIDSWLSTRVQVTAREVLTECIGLKTHEINRGHEMRVSSILQRLGWARERAGVSRRRVYVRA